MVPSRDAETSASPDGMNATQLTLWSWPMSVRMHSPVSMLHNFTLRSALLDADSPARGRHLSTKHPCDIFQADAPSISPEGWNATLCTTLV